MVHLRIRQYTPKPSEFRVFRLVVDAEERDVASSPRNPFEV